MHFVYILKLDDKDFYVGQTADLNARIIKHRKGDVPSTSHHKSVKVAWYAVFEKKETAIAFEKYLKSGAGRAFRNSHLI